MMSKTDGKKPNTDGKKDTRLYVRISNVDKEKLERTAEKQGKSLSTLARELLTGKNRNKGKKK